MSYPTYLDVHHTLAWCVIIGNALVGVWALAAQYVPVLRLRLLWIMIVVAELLPFAIAFVGVLIVNRFGVKLDEQHALYGFSALITVGILYSYRGSPFVKDKRYLLYGFGSLFLMGLGLRAMYLGVTR